MNALSPSSTLDALHPPLTALTPRTDYHLGRWVLEAPFRVDTLTGLYVVLTGSMPLVCHRNNLRPQALEFFARCGLSPTAATTYETADDAYTAARSLAAEGWKLASPYPLPDHVAGDESLLVPTALYNWLNDKGNLGELVAATLLADAVVVGAGDLAAVIDSFPGETVFVKACVAGASGSGEDVRYCPDLASRHAAADWLTQRGGEYHSVRIEQALDIVTCWCLNLAVLDGEVRYLGAAIQTFDSPGVQHGSRIDPGDAPPQAAIEAALAIAAEGQRRGYRGIAGFDIGVTPAGTIHVFDLNFRMAASTPQVLLHEAAVARVDARVSESWHVTFDGPLEVALPRLSAFGDDEVLIPTRLWDASPESNQRSLLTGFVVGDSAQQCAEITAEIGQAVAR